MKGSHPPRGGNYQFWLWQWKKLGKSVSPINSHAIIDFSNFHTAPFYSISFYNLAFMELCDNLTAQWLSTEN